MANDFRKFSMDIDAWAKGIKLAPATVPKRVATDLFRRAARHSLTPRRCEDGGESSRRVTGPAWSGQVGERKNSLWEDAGSPDQMRFDRAGTCGVIARVAPLGNMAHAARDSRGIVDWSPIRRIFCMPSARSAPSGSDGMECCGRGGLWRSIGIQCCRRPIVRTVLDDRPGLLLRSAIIAATIGNMRGPGRQGLERDFKERGPRVDGIDANHLRLFRRVYDRLAEPPRVRFNAGLHAVGKWTIGHLKVSGLQGGCRANVIQTRPHAA
jgi:hypothetical protein